MDQPHFWKFRFYYIALPHGDMESPYENHIAFYFMLCHEDIAFFVCSYAENMEVELKKFTKKADQLILNGMEWCDNFEDEDDDIIKIY